MADRAHPLAALAAAAQDCAAVQLSALPAATRLTIRTNAAPSMVTAVELPRTVCRAAVSGERAVLWLGPDEFLVLAPESEGALAQSLGAEPSVAVVDVSHRTAGIEVSGPRADWVINAFCALDLHPTSFPVGMCTRTVFGKSEIVLWRTDVDTFRIEVARSFAPYVWGCLEEARREFLA